MSKKRNVKATVDEETDRSCRESSSDGSVLENSTTTGVKNTKSRKCKVQGSNKTANILKVRATSKLKRLSESSCDSVAKEGMYYSTVSHDVHIVQFYFHFFFYNLNIC